MVHRAAAVTREALARLIESEDAISLLHEMKFAKSGHDPLDPSRPLNLIEQLNQTFTYLASLAGVRELLRRHPDHAPFQLNLGTAPGSDIISEDGTVAAEVFAATHPGSNQKLKKDLEKVLKTDATFRYIFYSCPEEFSEETRQGVVLVPLQPPGLRDSLPHG